MKKTDQSNQNYNETMTDPSKQQRDPTEPVRPRRPVMLTLMFWVFVLWTVLGWLRFARALVQQSTIESILPKEIYWYILLAGLVWGLLGLLVLWGLARGSRWAKKLLWVAALFYPVSYWVERLFLWEDPNAQRNWPFMLLLTLLWFGLTFFVLRSKRVQGFFHNKNQKG